jgi:hypothetical protein
MRIFFWKKPLLYPGLSLNFFLLLKRRKRGLRGEDSPRRKGDVPVGVMKDKELKLEEIEASHTLGVSGEGHAQGSGKWRGCTCGGRRIKKLAETKTQAGRAQNTRFGHCRGELDAIGRYRGI